VAGAVPLSFGGWHGDLVPWNFARRRTTWQIWDWEYWQESAPLGFERMEYVFGRRFFGGALRGSDAIREAVSAKAAAESGNHGDHEHAVTGTCFAFEILLRRLAIVAAGGGRDDDRAFPDLYLVVDELLRQGGAAVSVPAPSTVPDKRHMQTKGNGGGHP
jgi:hypothetical protein